EGHDGQDAALLLRLDRREPHRVPDTLHPLRGGRHRPGDPRGPEGGRARGLPQDPDPHRRTM
ncbi:MAG: putative membrane protein, partial [uncultured Rubrobacteraceae bacterium]